LEHKIKKVETFFAPLKIPVYSSLVFDIITPAMDGENEDNNLFRVLHVIPLDTEPHQEKVGGSHHPTLVGQDWWSDHQQQQHGLNNTPKAMVQNFCHAAETVRTAGASMIRDEAIDVNRQLLALVYHRQQQQQQGGTNHELDAVVTKRRRRVSPKSSSSCPTEDTDDSIKSSMTTSKRQRRTRTTHHPSCFTTTTTASSSTKSGVDVVSSSFASSAGRSNSSSSSPGVVNQQQQQQQQFALYQRVSRTTRMAVLMSQLEDIQRKLCWELLTESSSSSRSHPF
jgi:hypothetical protein